MIRKSSCNLSQKVRRSAFQRILPTIELVLGGGHSAVAMSGTQPGAVSGMDLALVVCAD
jgi:hypothetical protein